MARSYPQVVVALSPSAHLANFQGAYSEEVKYQPGQTVSQTELLWECVKTSLKHKPEESSEYWQLLGSLA